MKIKKSFVGLWIVLLFVQLSLASSQISNYSIQGIPGFYLEPYALNTKSVSYWQSTNNQTSYLENGYIPNNYLYSTAFDSSLAIPLNSSIKSQITMSTFIITERQLSSNNVSMLNRYVIRDGNDYYVFNFEIRLLGSNNTHYLFEAIVYRMLGIDYGQYFRNSFALLRTGNLTYVLDLITNVFPTRVSNVNRLNVNFLAIMETSKKQAFYLNLVYNFCFTTASIFSIENAFSISRSNQNSQFEQNLVGARFMSSLDYNNFVSNSELLKNRISNVYVPIQFSQTKYYLYSSPNLQSYTTLINVSNQYETYNATTNSTEMTQFEISYNYSLFVVVWETRYYYYENIIKDNKELGDWGLWNIIRDGICNFLNLVNDILQFLLFLLVVAFNYLLWTPLAYIIWLVNNYVLYYIAIGLTYIGFGVIYALIWVVNKILIMWNLIVLPLLTIVWNWIVNWIIENVWNPIVEFFRNGGLKILFDFYMIIVSYVIAFLLWVLTFGVADFNTIQQAIQSMLLQINATIFEFLSIFLENLEWILLSSATYVLLIGLIYIKYIYAKSRGYVTRASRLQSMINVYKIPLVLVVRLSQYFIGFLRGGVPTDGLND